MGQTNGIGTTMINKQIIFSFLLISSTATHGMEITNYNDALNEAVLHNSDIVSHITQQLWINRDYHILYVRSAIRALSCTNKFLYNYYSAENNQQKIIRAIARNNCETDQGAAWMLKFYAISKKIEYFIDIAKNKDGRFTQEDLQEKWYLNVTDVCSDSLAYKAIQYNNLEKAELIIKHSELDLTCKQLASLKDSIFWKIVHNQNNKNDLNKLKILRCVLDNENDLDKLKILLSVVQNKILLRKQNAQF